MLLFQVAQERDLDKDAIVDLMKLKRQMEGYDHLKEFPSGYIQEVSLEPFAVLFYTREQMVCLKKLLKIRPNSCLHLDATGNTKTMYLLLFFYFKGFPPLDVNAYMCNIFLYPVNFRKNNKISSRLYR